MADEIVYVTVTADVIEIVEVDAYVPEPIIVDVQITGNEGFTFVTDIEPETTSVGHTWFKTSTKESFVWYSGQWNAFPELAVPTGTIIQGGWTTAPVGCAFLNGQTLVNGAINYPLLAAYYPSWVSGNDLVLPDAEGMVLLATNGTPGTTPITSNAKTVTLIANNVPAHGHAFSDTSDAENRGHVHYLSGTNGGWTATASIAHTHTVSVNPGNSWRGWMYSKSSYTGTGLNVTTASADTNTEFYYHTSPGTSGASAGPSGYTTGAHQTHTHTVSGTTSNQTTTNAPVNYDTTPAHMLVKFAVKL